MVWTLSGGDDTSFISLRNSPQCLHFFAVDLISSPQNGQSFKPEGSDTEPDGALLPFPAYPQIWHGVSKLARSIPHRGHLFICRALFPFQQVIERFLLLVTNRACSACRVARILRARKAENERNMSEFLLES